MAEQYGSTKSYRILVYGNNFVKSSELFEKLQLSYPGNNCTDMAHARFEFYAYPDLNLFNRFPEPPIDSKIDNLILRTEGVGISLFIILISQTEVFSNEMKDMITEVPQNRESINEKYFWDHAIILFSFEENIGNDHNEVMNSIKGNKGIREVVGRAGNRYIWMSDSSTKEEIQKAILYQCKKVENKYSPLVHGSNNQYSKRNCVICLLIMLIATVVGIMLTCVFIIVIPPTGILVFILGPIIFVFFTFSYCMFRGISAVYHRWTSKRVNKKY